MDKKGIATSLVLAIIFGLTTIGMGTYIVYDNVKTGGGELNTPTNASDSTKVNKESTTLNDSDIPTSDLYAFFVSDGIGQFFKVENNNLYFAEKRVSLETGDSTVFDSTTTPYNELKYEKILENVKRIKSYHLRTDVLPVYYAILNDGSVKQIETESSQAILNDVDSLKSYKVDDFVDVTGKFDEYNTVKYNVKLQDGTTIEVNHKQ